MYAASPSSRTPRQAILRRSLQPVQTADPRVKKAIADGRKRANRLRPKHFLMTFVVKDVDGNVSNRGTTGYVS